MFCGNCGAKNDDNAKFCGKCGKLLIQAVPGKQGGSMPGAGGMTGSFTRERPYRETPVFGNREKQNVYRRQERRKISVIPTIAAVLIVAVMIFIGKSILSGGGETKLIKNFVEAEMTGDAETILDMIPKVVLEGAAKEMDKDVSELKDELSDEFDPLMKTINKSLGEGWSYSYEILEIKDLSEDEIADLEEEYSEVCELSIKKAKTATVEITIKEEDTDRSEKVEIGIIKVGGKWYLDIVSLGNLL